MNDKPLVSIVVLTYNSSKYVIDTLNSAYTQTYQGELELIVTDDYSTDSTIELCQQWLLTHGDRFVRAELLTVDENTGVSKNVNRGCRAAKGKWIKPIAGDDILTKDCIDVMCTKAIGLGEKCTFVVGSQMPFYETFQLQSPDKLKREINVPINTIIDINYVFDNPFFFIPGPCLLLSKEMLEDIGYYPEVFRNIEDFPLSRKALSVGYVIHVIDCPVVFYRKSNPQSISNTFLNELVEQRIVVDCYKLYLQPIFTRTQRWDTFLKLLRVKINIAFGGKAKLLVKFAFVISRYVQISYYRKNRL